jgi:hypothetical protein
MLAGVMALCSGAAMADIWDFSYTSSKFQATGTLQSAVIGGQTFATSGSGTLTYLGTTETLTLIPNSVVPGMDTIHGYPNSGGGDMNFTDLLISGTTDSDGLGFTVTGAVTGGFNPWNNQAAFFGNGGVDEDGGGTFTATDVGAFSSTPEPISVFLLGTVLAGICGLRVFKKA